MVLVGWLLSCLIDGVAFDLRFVWCVTPVCCFGFVWMVDLIAFGGFACVGLLNRFGTCGLFSFVICVRLHGLVVLVWFG